LIKKYGAEKVVKATASEELTAEQKAAIAAAKAEEEAAEAAKAAAKIKTEVYSATGVELSKLKTELAALNDENKDYKIYLEAQVKFLEELIAAKEKLTAKTITEAAYTDGLKISIAELNKEYEKFQKALKAKEPFELISVDDYEKSMKAQGFMLKSSDEILKGMEEKYKQYGEVVSEIEEETAKTLTEKEDLRHKAALEKLKDNNEALEQEEILHGLKMKKIQEENEKELYQTVVEASTALIESYEKRSDKKTEQLTKELEASKTYATQLQELAKIQVEGAAENLAYEQQKQAEIEKKKAIEEKKKKRMELGLAAVEMFGKIAETDPDKALTKTVSEIIKLLAFVNSMPEFAEGVIAFGGLRSTKQPDDTVVKIGKGESVINAPATYKYNKELEAINKGKYNPLDFISVPAPNNYQKNISDYGVINEIKMLNETLKNKAEYKIDVNAKILIKNNIVYLESLTNKAFWEKQSSYVMPEIEVLTKSYNTDELNPNYIIKYNYDISDMNTIDNFIGNNYERICKPIAINDVKHLKFGGLKEISLNVCRATRKDETSDFEDLLSGLAKIVDKVIKFFGGSSKYLQAFQDRIGSMNVSQHFGWSAKVLLLESGKIPMNNEVVLSAKYLYDNFHKINSFVENNYGGQYEIYEDITIPFCFHDFLKTIENSYFTDAYGNKGKFDKITWNFTQQYAKVSYRIQKPYTKNLTEIFIEPS